MGRLEEFAPVSLLAACRLLQSGQTALAAPQFEQAMSNDPSSLVAYIGLSQANASFRSLEIRRLDAVAQQNMTTPADKFKLGLQLYYKWCLQTPQQNAEERDSLLIQATTLLNQSWQATGQPLAGKMLAESYDFGWHDEKKAAQIVASMIQRLAGSRAYAIYQYAHSNGWNAATPSAELTPRQNLQGLRSALGEQWSLISAQVSLGTMQGGKELWVKVPTWDDQRQQSAYIERWREAIKFALQR